MKIRIAKFELYPPELPKGYAIGFDVTVNGRSFYRDALLAFEEIGSITNEEMTNMAWERLKDNILAEAERLSQMPALINGEWTPPQE